MKSSPFQVGIIIFFVIFIVLAMLIFTGVIGGGGTQSGKQSTGGTVFVWGTYPADIVGKLVSEYNSAHQAYTINYIPIQPGDLDTKLAEAIASGTGPDLVILSQDEILKNQAKLYPIPYTSLPEATFRATFAGEGELFMVPGGVIGLPLTVDPLIMYYNRDILEGAGITTPPKTWNDVIKMTPLLTKKDSNQNIIQSAVPFGIYGNLNNAGDIISMLLLQAGNAIVSKQGENFIPVIGVTDAQNAGSQVVPPAQAVVSFFTQFVDPTKETYTWNRSFTNARSEFIGGELAIYIGYASELPSIVAENPNLNFDVAKVPQPAVTGTQLTFGNMQAVAVVKASKNRDTAIFAASEITNADFAGKLVDALMAGTPRAPARRDLLGKVPQNVFAPTLYSSAIISRGWYSPSKADMNRIFSSMVDDVVRGASNITQAVGDAQSKFTVIFGR